VISTQRQPQRCTSFFRLSKEIANREERVSGCSPLRTQLCYSTSSDKLHLSTPRSVSSFSYRVEEAYPHLRTSPAALNHQQTHYQLIISMIQTSTNVVFYHTPTDPETCLLITLASNQLPRLLGDSLSYTLRHLLDFTRADVLTSYDKEFALITS